MKKITLILLGIMFSFNTLAVDISSLKAPDVSWQGDNKEHCIGNACFYIQHKKPDMFERLNKNERRQIINPYSPYDQDNSENGNVLTFSIHGGD
ncbi:hypothetical protein [Serratia sp. UGAL515B_01]|uniref:hypothetical protein n=1 Tax=Serratia sp. UGAL515B_01 TaxID=2986763 RepID=UPI0029550D78|nr:hypothetical protein [Serratia sp. UGAL515B_01]WON76438.1 hypothetical protein OK023_14610 [Serratia sp. UGAL515B_01]